MEILLTLLRYFCYLFTAFVFGGFAVIIAIAAWVDRENRKHKKTSVLSRYE
jgi:hypothetical protein